MNDQNASPDSPSVRPQGEPPLAWGVPSPGARRNHRVAVPEELRSAGRILQVLGIVGLIASAIALIGIMMLAAVVGDAEGAGAVVGLLLLSLVVGAVLSVAFLVQAPRVRDGEVRAGRVAVVLLWISIVFRVLALFPIEVSLGWLINAGLLVVTIIAVTKLRSAAAKHYYARA